MPLRHSPKHSTPWVRRTAAPLIWLALAWSILSGLPSAQSTELELRWQHATEGLIRSSPAVADSTVFVGSDDGRLYALDAASGALIWQHQTDGPVFSSPVVADGIVYVGSEDGRLYALDSATGNRVWQYATGASILTSPAVGTPAAGEGLVFVSSHDGYLYAFSAAYGAMVWRYATAFPEASSPVFAPGGVIDQQTCVTQGAVTGCPTTDGVLIGVGTEVHAIDAATGNPLWSYDATDYVWSSLTATDRFHYAGSADGFLHALDNEGALVWRYPTGNAIYSSPTAVAGVLYVASLDRYLYALNAIRGELLWRLDTARGIYSSPTVSQGVAYVASSDDHLYAVNTSTGELLARTLAGQGDQGSHMPWSSPTVAGDLVYVGGDDGSLYAFETLTIDPKICRGFFFNGCGVRPWWELDPTLWAILGILVTLATSMVQIFRGT